MSVIHCGKASAWLGRYLDGELPWGRRQALEEHLRECETCSRALAELGEMNELLGGVAVPPVPASLSANIVRRARTEAKPATAWRTLFSGWTVWPPARRFATAGAILAALYLGIVVGGALASTRTGAEINWLQFATGGTIVKAYMGVSR